MIQGYGFDLAWRELNEAAIAIQRGAYWVATNTDPTRPTDRGLVPGNGAAVAAVRLTVDHDPEVAGKPYRPLLDDTVERLGVARPLFVGDRLDTDIGGAVNAGLHSMLVLSGSHGPRDLLLAPPAQRPTYLGEDIGALLRPPAEAVPAADGVHCGPALAYAEDGALVVRGDGSLVESTWAAAHVAWAAADQGEDLRHDDALAVLDGLR